MKQKYLENVTKEELEETENNEELRLKWAQNRFVSDFQVNQKLDILEEPDIWNPATVMEVMGGSNIKKQIRVHYEGWAKSFDETLSISSRKIAPSGYALSNKSNLMRSKTVSFDWG